MAGAERFPYLDPGSAQGSASLLPYLPISLTYQKAALQVLGLLDTGSTINVLPYDVGLKLGASWSQQTTSVQLAGNLQGMDGRVLLVTGSVGHFAPVRLAFAWVNVNSVPVILGQTNFFGEFDVCFFRSQSVYEIRPKS